MNRDFWDMRYGEDALAYGDAPNDFVVEVQEQLDAGPLLDVGCGQGCNAIFLGSQGFPVTAVDSSKVGLERAARVAERAGVTVDWRQADLGNFDPGVNRWQTIVAIFVHLPPPLRKTVHEGLVDALVSGGLLVLEAYTPDQLDHGTGGPPALEMLTSLDDLLDDFEGMEFVVGRELVRPVIEGPYHQGEAAVVQVLARKP